MSSFEKKKCCHCKQLFHPEPRSRKAQKYCSKPNCRAASKRHSQQKWLSKPENRTYFQGPEHVLRVRLWRAKNPSYWKRSARSTLQDISAAQGSEVTKGNPCLGDIALQDISATQPLVLIGLLAQMTDSTLQDNIASTWKRLLQLAQDIISGGTSEQIFSYVAGQGQATTFPVQLARPALSP